MFGHRRYLFIILLVIIVVGGSIVILLYTQQKSEPVKIIESKLQIKLPATIKILNFDTGKKSDGIGAKLLIPNNKMKSLENDLDCQFGRKYVGDNKILIPNFINTYPWWDMKKENIIIAYHKFIDIKSFLSLSTREEWIFISKDINGKYYLFLSC